MQYTTLGKTGLKVSRLGFGGIPIQKTDAATTKKLIESMVEKGINYIDTAREKYLRQRHAYVNDPLGYGVRQGEMHIELVDGSEYAPDESDLSIVMMETDYKH